MALFAECLPENLARNEHSYEIDVYSLGMIIWAIVAKETKPFKEIEERIPLDTPEELTEIIESCWEENPSERIDLEIADWLTSTSEEFVSTIEKSTI